MKQERFKRSVAFSKLAKKIPKVELEIRPFFFSCLALFLFAFAIPFVTDSEARVASRFSLSLGEQYNDNIFFLKDKEHDFITYINPTFTLLYAPPGQTAPTFTADLTPIGQVFARHSDLSNFGDKILFDAGYTYRYSPRLTLHAADALQRLGETRTGDVGGEGIPQATPAPTALPPSGGTVPLPASQGLGDFISRGDELTNYFSLQGAFTYDPNISFTGGYSSGYTTFLERGGSDFNHNVTVRGVYKWRQEHNFHAGYSVNIIKSRSGEDNVVHNFDIGDDYFSTYQIKLAPTLTVSVSAGISVNTGSSGPQVANNTNLTLTKLWEQASLNIGVNKGLTPSFGVSGLSDTTTSFGNFSVRLTDYLTGIAGVNYSLFDTDDVNFNTFDAYAGFQYWITSWLSSNLRYTHRWLDSGAGAATTDLVTRGKINSNSVFLLLAAHFDLWPNFGLARGPALP